MRNEDMDDCEYRNEFGRPGTMVSAGQGAAVHAPVDNSVNKSMPWIVLVAILASAALGIAWQSSRAQDEKIRALETQVLLLREDVRQATIESARK